MLFFKCMKCGNFLTFIDKKPCDPVCCGETMKELKAGESDGAKEKHVPAVTVSGNAVHVQVGDVEHPMTDEHYIEFICVEYADDKGFALCRLMPGDAPEADFILADGVKAKTVYAYCNLHGLWKAEV